MTAPTLQTYIQGQGSVNADNLNTFEQTCNNVAELRAFVGAVGMQVFIRGLVSPVDGGQGPFYWNSTGTGPDDGGITNVVPTNAGIGCWTRIPISGGGGGGANGLGSYIVLGGSNAPVNARVLGISGTSITLTDNGVGSSVLLGTSALSGDVTSPVNSFVTTIASHAVTYSKIQQAGPQTLLGNPSGSTANFQEITLGTNLSFSGSVLNGPSTSFTPISTGWINYIIPPISVPALPGTLILSLPSGTASMSGNVVTYAAISATLGTNIIRDYWLNTDGSYTIETQSLNTYTSLPHYPTKLHIWRIQTDGASITAINFMADTYPVVHRPDDRAQNIDTFNEIFYLYNVTTAWSAGLSVVYGQLLLTAAGNVYQVAVPGTTGVSAPTSTATGNITDGSATLFYYTQGSYLGMFRYAQNNGLNWYFCNIALRRVMHRILLTGSPLGAPAGTTMASEIKNYIMGGFFHVMNDWQANSAYLQGMKIIVDGFIWICTTAGTTSATTAPFVSSRPHSIGQTVTDNTAIWKCIYTSYASQKWFWMDVDRTFTNYAAPDSHDSYASTFSSLIARYLQITGDTAWLSTASPQPGFTYAQVFHLIMNQNLDIQLGNFLSKTFQYDINPANGSSYTVQFLEDNCETVSAYKDAAYIYGVTGDSVNQAAAVLNIAYVASGVAAMYDGTYGLFAIFYGDPVSGWATNPNIGYYPWLQAQSWPELHSIPGINADQFLSIRLFVSQRWEAYWADKGLDVLPDTVHGFIAAFSWQDTNKAYAFVENVERYFTSGGGLYITPFGYYLDIKDSLVPEYRMLKATSSQLIYEDAKQNIITFTPNSGGNIRVVTAAGAVTVVLSDNIVIINKTVGAATTVNLPPQPVTNVQYTIKDGKGDAATNSITLTPAAGNIDGSSTYVMSLNYQTTSIVYNGTQWNVI